MPRAFLPWAQTGPCTLPCSVKVQANYSTDTIHGIEPIEPIEPLDDGIFIWKNKWYVTVSL